MDPYAHAKRIVQRLTRIGMPSEQLAATWAAAQPEVEALGWERLAWKARQEQVLSLLIERLSWLARETSLVVPIHAVEALWIMWYGRGPFLAAYQQTSDPAALLARLHEIVLEYWQRTLPRLLTLTLDTLARDGIEPLAIKGAALSLLYPLATRDMGDVDLITPDNERGWQAIRRLKEQGFVEEGMDAGKCAPDALGIKVSLKAPTGGAVELHLDGFDLLGLGLLEAPLRQRAQRKLLLGAVSSLVPAWEDSLLILVAHLCRERYPRIRDINDTYLILSAAGHELDWDYINRTARHNELADALAALIGATRAVYNLAHVALPQIQSRSVYMAQAARLMMRRSGVGHVGWSLPYLVGNVLRFNSRRYGLRVAAQHACDIALVTLEMDCARVAAVAGHGSQRKRRLAVMLRKLILPLLLRHGWRLWQQPLWGEMRLHAVAPVIDGRKQQITLIAGSLTDRRLEQWRRTMKVISGMIVWRAAAEDEPEFLITPAGVFHTTQYTRKFPLEQALLERRAGSIARLLEAEGIVAAVPAIQESAPG